MRTAIVLRVVLIGLAAVLGVALILHGNVVIGGLIAVMACVRLVLVAGRLRRRRARLGRMVQRRTARAAR